ncbi:odorant receptor 67c-like [Episyrphus balteatus]|uniref:odorant receptor 67c-like n=1 Tax=Episyrphus balteatus TaxID=286459 RepID=UPI0024857FBA|nr:odorant receptor 67c-like [Episyrphus balteatus]
MKTTNKAEGFLHGTIFYCRLMGFEFENKNIRMKVLFRLGFLNELFIMLGLCLYFGSFELGLHEKIYMLLYLNYYIVSVAKVISLIYHRETILQAFNEFRETHPAETLEKAYNLQTYTKKYKIIENVLVIFFWNLIFVFCVQPILLSFIDLVKDGKFTFNLTWMVWYGIEIPKENIPIYLLISLIQLTMRFDVIRKNIMLIEPDNTNEGARKLIKEIGAHQRFISLAKKLNTVFIPSVLLSLFSSSLILCFTGFQLLGEITFLIVIQAIFLLAYELKQVFIMCYLGDKMIEISLKISDAIYEHKWYNGTSKYKRLVLIVLMRSQHMVGLHVVGISEISLQTFKTVMSASYQIFTVLRST